MAIDTLSADAAPPRVRRRRDWRDGGRTVKPWDETVLATSLIALGAALLIAAAIRGVDSTAQSAVVAQLVVLVGMLTAIAIAFLRAKPRPLLRVRGVDVMYGLGFGLVLLLVQGWLSVAAGGSGALPQYSAAQAAGGSIGLLIAAAVNALLAPLIEELFFRGVLLVTTYSVVRRLTSRIPGAVAALVLTAAGSAVTHAWTAGAGWDAWVMPMILGLACGLLLFATGRVWGAVFVHFVFSAGYTLLMVAGTLWG